MRSIIQLLRPTTNFMLSTATAGALCAALSVAPAAAQEPAVPQGAASRGVEHTARINPSGTAAPSHPIHTAVQWAEASLARCRMVNDYSFTFIKREEVDGRLTEHETMMMKIRREPFSVYVHTLGPKQPRGQEAIFVAGRNGDKVLAHVTGFRHRLVGTLALDPTGPEMMEGNRYSLVTAGFDNMLVKILNMHRQEMLGGESDVQVIGGAKLDGLPCTCVQVAHREVRPNFILQSTRTFYDDATLMPVRYEAYSWPARAGEAPRLVEEYTYRNVRLNAGMNDVDFDVNNPQYGYR